MHERIRRTMELKVTDFCKAMYEYWFKSSSVSDVCNGFAMSPVDEIIMSMIMTIWVFKALYAGL